jgi:hypothetical protein
MTRTQTQPGQSARRFLVAAAVLEVTAGALGLAGLAFATIAVTSLTRQRVATMPVPPSELARRQLAKARAATTAGVGVWRSTPVVPDADRARRDRATSLL